MACPELPCFLTRDWEEWALRPPTCGPRSQQGLLFSLHLSPCARSVPGTSPPLPARSSPTLRPLHVCVLCSPGVDWCGGPLLSGPASCSLLFPQALIVGYAFHFPHLLSPQIQCSAHRARYRQHVLGIVLQGPALCFAAALFSLFFVPLVSAGTAPWGPGRNGGHRRSDVPTEQQTCGWGQSRRQAGVPPRVLCVRPRAAVSGTREGVLLHLRPRDPACQGQRRILIEGRGS